MAQSTVFPIRFGLPLQAPENIKAVEVLSEGGLDLTQSIIENRAGCASNLINFEPSVTGGYRRINGYDKFSSTVVPGQGNILGVAVAWPNEIITARQSSSPTTEYNLYKGTGTTWTQLNPSTTTQTGTTNGTTTLAVTSTTGLIPGQPVTSSTGDIAANSYIITVTPPTTIIINQAATGSHAGQTLTFHNPLQFTTGMVVNSCFYDWSGPVRTAFFDGVNFPYRWDNINGFVVLTGTAAAPTPLGPTCGCEFEGYLVIGGFISNPGAIAWSAPLNDNDWTSADGSVIAIVGDLVTWLKDWRQQLIVFCNKSITRIIPNSLNTTGVSPPPAFQIQPITSRIGCFVGRTVREINGDLVFLAPDGLRTISGTFNIGDTDIGSISRPIQGLLYNININETPPVACVIHKKTQYRLFYPNLSDSVSSGLGIVAGVRRFRDGHEGWEFGQLQGFQPTCCDSGYLQDGNEYVVHGGTDGFIYRQEQGGSLNGALINEVYTTVPLELGDIGLRKAIKRITIYVSTDEGGTTLSLRLIYNYNNPGTIQPPTYLIKNVGNAAVLYNSGTLYNSGAIYGVVANTTIRQLVQGSGFVVQIQTNYSGSTPGSSYTIQGYYVEYFPGGRR